jgi:hypothetical protein
LFGGWFSVIGGFKTKPFLNIAYSLTEGSIRE